MGYRGKVKEQEQARALRARNRTLADIAQTLGVSKSSVSLWVRDVPFTPTLRLRSTHRRPHPAHEAKLRQIEELNLAGRERIRTLSETEFLVAGVALYAGEGAKGDGCVQFANTDPAMIRFFCSWLRRFFEVDESRLRARVYLHEGLDLERAETFWSTLTGVPRRRLAMAAVSRCTWESATARLPKPPPAISVWKVTCSGFRPRTSAMAAWSTVWNCDPAQASARSPSKRIVVFKGSIGAWAR